ncbi:MAG TPA: response regulator, partial [Syntrophothermus lipocalidus]|nr:response regulator [Syntrophothermus lipocalidus]
MPTTDQPTRRILVVEDSLMASRLLTNVLEAHGYLVEAVSRGEEAVQRAASDPLLDLILTDIELAGDMDGAEAALRISEACDVPIVFLTAHSSKEVFEKIRSSRGYGFVVKGTDVYALLSTIEMALSLRRANAQAAFYQKILEDSLNEIYVFDPGDFRILMANRGLRQNLGYSMSELSQMRAVDFHIDYNPASFHELLQPLHRAHAEKVQYQGYHLRKDGTS